MIRAFAFVVAIVLLALGIYALYDAIYGPPRVVLKYGKVTARSKYDPAKVAERRTRQVQRGKKMFWEVELPSGSWLDCGGDCAEAYRRSELDPWQSRKEEAPR